MPRLAGFGGIESKKVRAELDTSTLEAEVEKLLAEVESAAAAIDKLIDRNAKSALNQDEYARRFNAPHHQAREAGRPAREAHQPNHR